LPELCQGKIRFPEKLFHVKQFVRIRRDLVCGGRYPVDLIGIHSIPYVVLIPTFAPMGQAGKTSRRECFGNVV